MDKAQRTAERLVAMGFSVTLAPLLRIDPLPWPVDFARNRYQAVVVTSPSGAKRLMNAPLDHALPVFAVGEATAAAARTSGFSNITVGAGDGAALARQALTALDPLAGRVLRLAGRDYHQALDAILIAAGYDLHTVLVYEALALPLTPEAQEGLANGLFQAALFYSPRTTRLFIQQVRNLALPDRLIAGIAAYGLSPAVTDALAAMPFRLCRVPDRPDENALLAMLAGDYAQEFALRGSP